MSKSDKDFDSEKISSRYIEVLLPDGKPIFPRAKDAAFAIICACP